MPKKKKGRGLVLVLPNQPQHKTCRAKPLTTPRLWPCRVLDLSVTFSKTALLALVMHRNTNTNYDACSHI